ncbi:MAG: NAD(P)/FAD-dependent oxidoreductase, partial [Burkholderiaceae bacterium]
YCGASPFLAPATLMLVAHVEQSGVWLVKGGMYRIAMALEHLLKRHGAHVRYNSAVSRLLVRDGQVTGVCLADGEVIEARAVVFNGDVAALSSGLLGTESMRAVPRTMPSRRSLSAVTWHMLSPAKGFPLLHHTVFFSGNYADEFRDVRGAARLPQDPTVYVCAQDRGDVDAQHPAGAERIMCLLNAAATADTNPLAASAVAQCEERMFDKLARCGLHVDRTVDAPVVTTPSDFHRMFPATGGALYGAASHGWMASFSRPGSRCRLRGLYLAGGSTHPGPGLPMAALSGRQAAQSLLHDLDQASARGRR